MDIRVDASVAVIFDLDDTLYNEVEYLKSAFRHIARMLDATDEKPLYAKMLSLYRNQKDVFEFLTSEYPVDKELLLKLYREHRPEIKTFEGVFPLLKSIKKSGGYTGIITDGRKLTQMNKIKALGVGDYMDCVVISEETGYEKPHPWNFQKLMELLAGKRYYYIADNLRKDFVAPNELGWTTIGLIDNGLNIHKDCYRFMQNGFKPMHFISRLSEVRVVA